ncbi:hypothetical protein [Steroidobacter sp.]|uniref:hypothetical protein n=1 Tax=Steroidobacter sp. TaxID=1978227 RepID=UPI001A62698E|nr:hypothetical protein [Steroidobacter sp.]MBL8272040.1 hypothetical protein [Steroidobacter sp.]
MEDNASKVYVEPDSSQPPLVSQNTGSGTQLFVINLCASIAPVATDGRNIPGLENYKLYQVARVEDGRTRHRLRLGFFTNEAHAERVLTVVRQQYPTAFTASLSEEDRRFTRGYLPERAPAPKAAAPVVAKPKAPTDEVVEMTWEPDEETKAAASSASLPKIKALTEAAGLAEMSWNDEPTPTAAPAPSKEPLAVGLLSGKFAALDTSKLKIKSNAPAPVESKAVTPPAPAANKSVAPPVLTASKPVTPPAPVLVPPKLDTASSVRVPALTFSDPAPTPAAPKNAAPAEPYHVGKGLNIEDVDAFELDLYDDAPGKAAKAAAPVVTNPVVTNKAAPAKPLAPPVATKPVAKPAVPVTPAAKPAAPAVNKTAAASAKPVPAAPVRDASLVHPNLDSTQTIRALTTEELNDAAQEKWFAIQLAASDQPVNLDTMPHLDIFEAYSLYSVATAGSGKIVHSLRLGFFKEAVSAEAVSGYLKTFFASPSVLRISVAEQARFKDAPQPRRAEPAEEPKNNVVALNNARASRAPVVPTVTMEVDPSATGAFRANATGAFRPNATGSLSSASGSFKPGGTGAFKPTATGSFKANATGTFKLNSTGMHKALDSKVAAKSAAPATKRSEPTRSPGNTGKHKQLKKSLSQELMDEAREVELSESGIRKLPQNGSLLSRLLGKKK